MSSDTFKSDSEILDSAFASGWGSELREHPMFHCRPDSYWRLLDPAQGTKPVDARIQDAFREGAVSYGWALSEQPRGKLAGAPPPPPILSEGPAPDPWANRSAGMRCGTCVWFVPKAVFGPYGPLPNASVGRCRRHAPTMGGYPVVMVADWCGDHRLDENKVVG